MSRRALPAPAEEPRGIPADDFLGPLEPLPLPWTAEAVLPVAREFTRLLRVPVPPPRGPLPDAPREEAEPWPSAAADASGDLLSWEGTWTTEPRIRGGIRTTGEEPLCRVSARGAWEVRADVAALLTVPRWGSHPDGAAGAILEVHRALCAGRDALRRAAR